MANIRLCIKNKKWNPILSKIKRDKPLYIGNNFFDNVRFDTNKWLTRIDFCLVEDL